MMIEVVNNVQVCFGIMYRRENQRQYELRADTVSECKAWIDAIKMARSGQSVSDKEIKMFSAVDMMYTLNKRFPLYSLFSLYNTNKKPRLQTME